MHIDRLAAQDAARTYLQKAEVGRSAAADAQAQAGSRTDSVTLSTNAKTLAATRDLVANAPGVREEKVTDIKQRIADGTYSVPARVLARNLLNPTNTPAI
jgi:negative regulator of flagellin synthesis FlgM